MRVAAVDCGTNTFRILIASLDDRGQLVEHDRRLSFVRLGQDVDATRQFHIDALARAKYCLRDFAKIIAAQGVAKTRVVATSAVRDVANREAFQQIVREQIGIEVEVISGIDEAELSFAGALSGVQADSDPVLVIDSGGGSTELVLGSRSGRIETEVSINVGSRRIRERYLHGDPPSLKQSAQACAVVNAELDACEVDFASVSTFIGLAGTVTSMSALAQELPTYDRSHVHGSILTREQIAEVTRRLLSASVSEVAAWGPVAPERAEVLCAGALIVNEVAARVGASALQVSEADLLDGLALAMLTVESS